MRPAFTSYVDEDTFRSTPEERAGSTTTIIDEPSTCEIVFNVMPERKVWETLRISRFSICESRIEAEFDRTYGTTMIESPSHLTFVSALIQMQKIMYVYACHRFGFSTSVEKQEVLKIWPTDIKVRMRDLVREEHRLVHRIDFSGFRKIDSRKYLATASSQIGNLEIDGSAMLLLHQDPR